MIKQITGKFIEGQVATNISSTHGDNNYSSVLLTHIIQHPRNLISLVLTELVSCLCVCTLSGK